MSALLIILGMSILGGVGALVGYEIGFYRGVGFSVSLYFKELRDEAKNATSALAKLEREQKEGGK